MKFHEYDTLFNSSRKHGWSGSVNDFYVQAANKMMSLAKNTQGEASGKIICGAENDWINSGRPYYKVWPSIIPAFLKVRFGVPTGEIDLPGDLCTLLIRFPDTTIPVVPGLRTILFTIFSAGVIGRQLFMLVKSMEHGKNWAQYQALVLRPNETIEDSMNQWKHPCCVRVQDGTVVEQSPQVLATDYLLNCLRIAVSICLLHHDPSIIQPDVLADDRNRFDRSTDPAERQRLVDKAARRGVVGWRIGEEYEVCPHFRRPHFALRHTGPHGTVPKIVPVRSCIVHRKKVTDVPTGYMTPEGEEVEV